MIVSWT